MFRIIAFDPVDDFVQSLDEDAMGRTLRAINLLETHGYLLGMPHSKHISGKIHELRVRGDVEVRIFYAFHQSIIYLLHGFIKKSQKTPAKGLKVAQQRFISLTRS